jgi:hypothetical protein
VPRAREEARRFKPNSATFLAALQQRPADRKGARSAGVQTVGSPRRSERGYSENSVASDLIGDESLLSAYSGSEIEIAGADSRYGDELGSRSLSELNYSLGPETLSEAQAAAGGYATISSIPSKDFSCEPSSSADLPLAELSG